MSSTKDSKLNDLIRLKRTPAPPVERWHMTATKASVPTVQRVCSPLRCSTNAPKTPDRNRLVVKYKKTPKVKSPTSYKTPNQKTSISLTQSLKKKSSPKPSAPKTPGKTSQTPGGCRFIPNRSVTTVIMHVYTVYCMSRGTTDMEYSSFLVNQGGKEEDVESPSTESYREGLLQALSHGKRRQRGVLSFKSTPAQKGEILKSIYMKLRFKSCSHQETQVILSP